MFDLFMCAHTQYKHITCARTHARKHIHVRTRRAQSQTHRGRQPGQVVQQRGEVCLRQAQRRGRPQQRRSVRPRHRPQRGTIAAQRGQRRPALRLRLLGPGAVALAGGCPADGDELPRPRGLWGGRGRLRASDPAGPFRREPSPPKCSSCVPRPTCVPSARGGHCARWTAGDCLSLSSLSETLHSCNVSRMCSLTQGVSTPHLSKKYNASMRNATPPPRETVIRQMSKSRNKRQVLRKTGE